MEIWVLLAVLTEQNEKFAFSEYTLLSRVSEKSQPEISDIPRRGH